MVKCNTKSWNFYSFIYFFPFLFLAVNQHRSSSSISMLQTHLAAPKLPMCMVKIRSARTLHISMVAFYIILFGDTDCSNNRTEISFNNYQTNAKLLIKLHDWKTWLKWNPGKEIRKVSSFNSSKLLTDVFRRWLRVCIYI